MLNERGTYESDLTVTRKAVYAKIGRSYRVRGAALEASLASRSVQVEGS